MKVYVEEKDIDVIEGLFDATHCYECWECNRDDNLEIVSLADYTKQVRKEALGELMNILNESQYMNRHNSIDKETLFKVLDQIQGETNG